MKVLEIFSGIGGMHLALKESGVQGEIVLAVDINPTANEIYKHNFPNVKLLNRNIQSLSPKFLNSLGADTILMSPPCQPFTRNGLKRDVEDPRSIPFLYILQILPDLNISKILIENVKGFETSKLRNLLMETLEKCQFLAEEFLLSPHQFNIPNSRLRYYCIASKIPDSLVKEAKLLRNKAETNGNECPEIRHFLDPMIHNECFLPMTILKKYWKTLDICYPESKNSCCFTKAYGRFAEGTGSVFTNKNCCESVFQQLRTNGMTGDTEEVLLKSLNLRYFHPSEVCRLMCFPKTFSFPENITTRQKYMVLGNSINVEVVSELIKLLK